MKTISDQIKSYLNFSTRVLGISHVYITTEASVVVEKKKIMRAYYFNEKTQGSLENPLEIKDEIMFESSFFLEKSIRTIFVFSSHEKEFDQQLWANSELIFKMNQSLSKESNQTRHDLVVAWLTPHAELDFFSFLDQSRSSFEVVFFRDEVSRKETIYNHGGHRILETLSPLSDPGNIAIKRHVWNDFKRFMVHS